MNKIARDYLALGSWVFYALVLSRALIGPYWDFILLLVIAAIGIFIAQRYTEAEMYSTKVVVLAYATIQFYADPIYTIFACVIALGVPISAYTQDKSTRNILLGGLTAAISVIIAESIQYFLQQFL